MLSSIFAAGVAGVVIACCALFGWGRLTRRLSGLTQGTWPLTIALGLGSVIFLGGILNLSRLAYPVALDAVLILGLSIAAYEWYVDRGTLLRTAWPATGGERLYLVSWCALVVVLMGFTIATQLAPRLYNFFDDFQKYFAYPVRMIETGTLYGSPVNALGSETLGAQAFLHGFIVAHFPIYFINGVDAVFCFGLCLLLAGCAALGRPRWGIAASFGVLAVFFIHAQSVNVSALFSSVALYTAIVLLRLDSREHANEGQAAWRSDIGTALLYAAAFALKPTGLLFLGLQFAFCIGATALGERAWRPSLTRALRTVLWTTLFLSPWLLLYVPHYFFAMTHTLPEPAIPIPSIRGHIELLSPATMYYGGSYLAYTSIAAGLGIYAVAALYRGLRRVAPVQRTQALILAGACAAAAVNYFFIVLVLPSYVDVDTTIRFTIPALIGVVPLALGFGALVWDGPAGPKSTRHGTVTSVASGVVLIALFFPIAVERVKSEIEHGSSMSFLPRFGDDKISELRIFDDAVLHGAVSEEIQTFQSRIPPGEKIIAWIEMPFLLDYARNPIAEINDGGLATTWSVPPEAKYLMWQYAGYGIRPPEEYLYFIRVFGGFAGLVANRGLSTYRSFEALARAPDTEIISDEDGVAILRLGKPAGDASPAGPS